MLIMSLEVGQVGHSQPRDLPYKREAGATRCWGRSVTDLLATLLELEHLGVGVCIVNRGAGPDHARRKSDDRTAGNLR